MCNSRLIEEKSLCDTLDATLVTTHNPAFVIKGLRAIHATELKVFEKDDK